MRRCNSSCKNRLSCSSNNSSCSSSNNYNNSNSNSSSNSSSSSSNNNSSNHVHFLRPKRTLSRRATRPYTLMAFDEVPRVAGDSQLSLPSASIDDESWLSQILNGGAPPERNDDPDLMAFLESMNTTHARDSTNAVSEREGAAQASSVTDAAASATLAFPAAAAITATGTSLQSSEEEWIVAETGALHQQPPPQQQQRQHQRKRPGRRPKKGAASGLVAAAQASKTHNDHGARREQAQHQQQQQQLEQLEQCKSRCQQLEKQVSDLELDLRQRQLRAAGEPSKREAERVSKFLRGQQRQLMDLTFPSAIMTAAGANMTLVHGLLHVLQQSHERNDLLLC